MREKPDDVDFKDEFEPETTDSEYGPTWGSLVEHDDYSPTWGVVVSDESSGGREPDWEINVFG